MRLPTRVYEDLIQVGSWFITKVCATPFGSCGLLGWLCQPDSGG